MTFDELKEQAIQNLWHAIADCELYGVQLVDTRDGRVESSMWLTYKED